MCVVGCESTIVNMFVHCHQEPFKLCHFTTQYLSQQSFNNLRLPGFDALFNNLNILCALKGCHLFWNWRGLLSVYPYFCKVQFSSIIHPKRWMFHSLYSTEMHLEGCREKLVQKGLTGQCYQGNDSVSGDERTTCCNNQSPCVTGSVKHPKLPSHVMTFPISAI